MYKLKREVSLRDAVMINLGAIIGAGIFVIIGIASYEAGSSIILSIVVSAIVALFTGLSFSEIALHTAKEGGVYEFTKESLHPFAGFIGGLLWTLGTTIALAAVSISMIGYINTLFSISLPITLVASLIIILFAFINTLGIKSSARTITILVIINVMILLIFIFFGSHSINYKNFYNFMPNGISGMLLGAATIFFAFTGFSRITTIGDEVKDPKHTIPKAIIISIIISAIIYTTVAIIAVGMIGTTALGSSTAPLSLAISKLNNPLLLLIISLGGITATAGVIFTGILGVSRVFFAMGRDNELPKGLSRLDRFATPINAIILSAIIGILFTFFVSFKNIVEASNSCVLSAYVIINIAALFFWYKENNKKITNKSTTFYTKIFPIIPLLGILTIFIILIYIIGITLPIIITIFILGTIYYKYRNSRVNKSAIPMHSKVRAFGKSRSVQNN
ncbi:MAG: amino acid permease [Candidatus Marsarchaeota archaeon]|nr:amino acid permease [Candidatus Marsarchaeota archaeon]